MYAGAERVVASLWRVDDVATAQLMTEFYREMFENKLKPAAVLGSAQRKLANSRRWHNPHYWAGFVLLGEWR
jgi:CHAT domain-containing protein